MRYLRQLNPRTGFRIICTIFVLFGIAIGWNKYATQRDIATAIEWGGLAALPQAATPIQVFRNESLMWTGYYIKFSASAEQINTFLDASPGLKQYPHETFNPNHQDLPASQKNTDSERTIEHRYFSNYGALTDGAPWFDRTIQQVGRRYSILWKGKFGEVVVDDVRHIVYISVANS